MNNKYYNSQKILNKIRKYRLINDENIENVKKLALRLFIQLKSNEWNIKHIGNKNEKTNRNNL